MMTRQTLGDTDGSTRKKRGRKAPNFWAEWVNTHTAVFNTEEVFLILELEEKGVPDVNDFITAMADVGVKTTCKFDRRTNQYHMQVFRDNPEATDAGYALAVRANSFHRCVVAMLFALRDVHDFDLEAITEIREAFVPDL